jgi:hypothetical protein
MGKEWYSISKKHPIFHIIDHATPPSIYASCTKAGARSTLGAWSFQAPNQLAGSRCADPRSPVHTSWQLWRRFLLCCRRTAQVSLLQRNCGHSAAKADTMVCTESATGWCFRFRLFVSRSGSPAVLVSSFPAQAPAIGNLPGGLPCAVPRTSSILTHRLESRLTETEH